MDRDILFLGADPLETADRLETLAADLRLLAKGIHPDNRTILAAPILHGWGFVRRPSMRLQGRVFGHPAIADGKTAITSEIFAIDPQRRWARTMSRFYDLGHAGLFGGDDGQG